MTILLIVGVGLVALGALVLLRFPDRPGGRIAWQGFEVSSLGAGLPVIALGVVAIALGGAAGGSSDFLPSIGGGASGSAGGTASAASGADVGDCFRDAPPERLDTLEEGTDDYDVIQANEPKGEPFWLALTDGGAPLGGVRFRFFLANELFKVERLVDANCRPIDPVASTSRGGDPRVLQNWDTLRLRFGENLYDLRIGASSTIRVDFLRFRE